MSKAITAPYMYLWSILIFSTSSSFADWAGCSIFGLPPLASEAQVAELLKMESLDFFVGPSMHSETEVMACAEDQQKPNLLKLLEANNIKPKILVSDMSKLEISSRFVELKSGDMDWKNYHSVKNVHAWLDKVVKAYPKLISMKVIVQTPREDEMRLYTIEKQGGSTNKRGVYLQCLISGREWTISGACSYIIDQLTENSGRYSSILDNIRFYIVPFFNADGYSLTNGIDNHLWNKNLDPLDNYVDCNVTAQKAAGVDLNRNWPFRWQAFDDICSPRFPGEVPDDNPDTRNILDYLMKQKDIDTFIDIHSYSQFIMVPWAYTKDRVENYDALMKIAKDAADAAESVRGNKFQHGQYSKLFSSTSGTPLDWAVGTRNIPYAFALYMGPTSSVASGKKYIFPFRPPPSEILPVAQEAWLAVLSLATQTKQSSYILSNAARPQLCTFFLLSAFIGFV